MSKYYLSAIVFFIPTVFADTSMDISNASIDSINLSSITNNIELYATTDYLSNNSITTAGGRWLNMYDNNSIHKYDLTINSNDYLVTIENYFSTYGSAGSSGATLSARGDVSLTGNYAFLNNTNENTDDGTSSGGTNDVQGGALKGETIVINTGNDGTITFSDNKIIAISAAQGTIAHQVNAMGGAIRANDLSINGLAGATVLFKDNQIKGNTVYGGAVYAHAAVALSGDNMSYTFNNNTAEALRYSGIGGAIYIGNSGNSSLTMNASNSDYVFSNNTITSLSGASASGGAIGTAQGGSVPIIVSLNGDNSSYIFRENKANSTLVHNVGLNSGYGGAIFVGGELYLNNSSSHYSFDDNRVTADNSYGGAVAIMTTTQMYQAGEQRAKLELTNTSMNNNSVVSDFGGSVNQPIRAYGGAIYAFGSDIVISGNSSFTNNSASVINQNSNPSNALAAGGAIYSTSAIKTLASGVTIAVDVDVTMDLSTNSGENITFSDNYYSINGAITANDIYWDGNATGGSHTVNIATQANSQIAMLSSIGASENSNLTINKTGAGSWLLAGESTLLGLTNININDGKLQFSDNNTKITLDKTNGSYLVIGGQGSFLGNYGTIIGNVENSGAFFIGGVSEPTTLIHNFTIDGDYTGNNGQIYFNTELNDDNSLTDRLVITGNASGTTHVNVVNLGGLGAQTIEGIEIVDVAGTSTDSAFVKNGRIVAGAYDYSLYKGSEIGNSNSESWFLTSVYNPTPEPTPDEHVIRPEAGAYLGNLIAANTMFNLRLHDRLGETQYTDLLTGEQKVTSMWLRYQYGYTKFGAGNQIDSKNNWNVTQLGGDIAQWSSNDSNRLHVGLMAGYARSTNDSSAKLSGYEARGKVDGYSAGFYGTWYDNDADKTGLYIDSWALWNDFDASVHGDDLDSEKYDMSGLTASIESGYTFLAGQTENHHIWLQPKAQLTWMGVDADNHTESNGTRVSGSGDNLQTRLGLRATMGTKERYNLFANQGGQLFIEANWLYNTKPFSVQLDDVKVTERGARNIGEIKSGVEGNIYKNTNVWFNLAYQRGDHDYSNAAVMLGAKYSF